MGVAGQVAEDDREEAEGRGPRVHEARDGRQPEQGAALAEEDAGERGQSRGFLPQRHAGGEHPAPGGRREEQQRRAEAVSDR